MLAQFATRVVVSLLFFFPAIGIANAQGTAVIEGTVLDTSGGVIPGVTVVVTNQETNATRETMTGDAGTYRVTGLAPGRYTVKASLSGFTDAVVKDLIVEAEEVGGLDITLEPVSTNQHTSARFPGVNSWVPCLCFSPIGFDKDRAQIP